MNRPVTFRALTSMALFAGLTLAAGTGFAQAPDAGKSMDAELNDLKKSQAEFNELTKQLDQQRKLLEQKMEAERAAQERKRLYWTLGVLAALGAVGGGVWLRSRGKPEATPRPRPKAKRPRSKAKAKPEGD